MGQDLQGNEINLTPDNIAWLRKGVEWVEEQEKLDAAERTWLQAEYVASEEMRTRYYRHAPGCGTAYCYAGYLASQVEPKLAETDCYEDYESGELVFTTDVAERLLGLEGVHHGLFVGSNTAAIIRQHAERLAGEPL